MTQRKIALSIEEAADYTGIGRNTLRQLVEWKKLPVLKVGRKVLIKTDILEMLLSFKLDAPSPCRLDAPDLDLICYASADCLHQHLQVI